MTITADAEYEQAHKNAPDYDNVSPAEFAEKYNGVQDGKNVASIGTLSTGTFSFTFHFTYADGSDAVIDYLPLTFYDLDGGAENVATCDAVGEAVHKPNFTCVDDRDTKVYYPVNATCDDSSECSGALKCFADAYPEEVQEPEDWADMNPEQKLAAVTYLFKGKSTFDMTYTTTKQHRVYIFRGSNELICKEQGATTPSTTQLCGQTQQCRPDIYEDVEDCKTYDEWYGRVGSEIVCKDACDARPLCLGHTSDFVQGRGGGPLRDSSTRSALEDPAW